MSAFFDAVISVGSVLWMVIVAYAKMFLSLFPPEIQMLWPVIAIGIALFLLIGIFKPHRR